MTGANRFNNLPARPEHIAAVRRALADGEPRSLNQTASLSRLTLTQATCAVDAMERDGELDIIRQNRTPKILVKLREA